MKFFKNLIALGIGAALTVNTAMPIGIYAADTDSATDETITDTVTDEELPDDSAEEVSTVATITAIKASDNVMSSDYLKKYRIGTDTEQDVYISAYSNNKGCYSTSYLKYAFDGDWSTHWETGNGNVLNYVDVTFNKATEIDRMLYATRQDSAKGKGYPKKLTIYSYNEETSDWEAVVTGESAVSTSYVLITFPRAIEFTKLRFEFTEANNGWASASELAFLRPEEKRFPCDEVIINGTAAVGKTLSAKVGFECEEYAAYQWQYSDDGVNYYDIEGANESTYTIESVKSYYRVKAWDSTGRYYGTEISEPYKGSIEAAVSGDNKIGGVLLSEAKYVGDTEQIYYKWQYSSDNSNFADIENAVENEYVVPIGKSNGYIRTGVSVDGENYAYSDSVFIPVTAVMMGAPQVGATLTAGVNDEEYDNLAYVWQIGDSVDGEFADIENANAQTYTPTDDEEGKYLRVRIGLGEGVEVTSEPWLIEAAGSYKEYDGDYIYLSDLPSENLLSQSVGSGGSIKLDQNYNGNTISLLVNGAKKYFLKGMLAHATANVVYDVSYFVEKCRYNRFRAYIGIDLEAGTVGDGAGYEIYTSQDNNTWTKIYSKTTKITDDAVYVDLDISNAKYLKFVTLQNGTNYCDHIVFADAKLSRKNYTEDNSKVSFIKTLKEYDDEITKHVATGENATELLQNEDYRANLLQRTFVSNFGYDLLQSYATYDEQFRETIQWLFNDNDNLEMYLMGGAPSGTYVKSMQVLGNLLEAHGEDLKDETNGELYKKMMITLSLTHSKTVRFWMGDAANPDGLTLTKNISDPVKRYEIYKQMYLDGKLYSAFDQLEVEEMRFVMNTKLSDDEILWLRDYIYNRFNGNYFKYDDWIYYQNGPWLWHDDVLYDDDAVKEYSKNFGNFLDYGVENVKYAPSLWMVYATYGICWHISNAGSNVFAAYGVPTMTLGQPCHVFYIYSTPDSEGNVTWNSRYGVSGWDQTRFETYTGDEGYYNQRPLCSWGVGNYTNYSTSASYIWLSQPAIDDFDSYSTSQKIMEMANVYDDVNTKRDLYKKATEVCKYNFDAYLAWARSYADDENVSDTQRYELASLIVENLGENPLPVNDLWVILNNQITDTVVEARMSVLRSGAVRKWESSSDGNVRTVTTLISGDEDSNKLASFSFDGENAGKIILSENYTAMGSHWDYSLDGGKTWKEVSTDSEQLTEEQLASLNGDDDIKIHIMGLNYDEENIYTIDLTQTSLPTNLSVNDLENRLMATTSAMEWSYVDDKTAEDSEDENTETEKSVEWHDFGEERFEGNISINVRMKYTGTDLGTEPVTYTFTEDDNTPEKSYVYFDRMSVEAFSSQHDNSSKASNTIDGRKDTIWHTNYSNGAGTDTERYIIYNFEEPLYLTSIRYTPRQSGSNGRFLDCEVYVSNDKENWTLAGSATNWADSAASKTLELFAPTYAKYVKVIGTRTSGGFGSAALMEFFENTELANEEPTGIKIAQNPAKTKYILGESFDTTGMRVNAVYESGAESTIDNSLLVIEAETFDSEGDKKIAVKYGDFTAYIDVTVVSSENCEAAIGDVNYITLKEAVEKADENDVVILKKDIALNECIAVPNDVTITNADGNAFSISRKVDTAGEIPSCYLFDVPIGGSLTLKNVVIDGGAIWNEDMTSNTGIKSVKALIGVTGGNLVIGEGAVLQNNFDDSAYVQTKDAGGAVFANAGTVTIDGGSIIYNKGRFGGAVIVKGTAALVMESGNVSNNFATSSGGAFRSEDKAPITINGGVLENNKSNSEGGTIWISNGKLTINGGTIGKSSAESGGLIMVNDSGTIAINGTDGISGEIKMKVNKAIEINGDVKDSDMTVRLASNPTSDYKLATLGENANAASAVKALTVSGYNSYYKPDGVYITTRDLASDVNMDGSIDKVDAAAVLKIISDIDGDNFNEKRADINGDGNVDMLDVVELLKLTA